MALTHPIRDKSHLKQLANYFIGRGQYRNHLLLVTGAHTALRIGDILKLKWADVYDTERGAFHSHITLTEHKTGKSRTIALHPAVINALRLYFPYRYGEFIFAGNRKDNKAISRIQAWRIIHYAAAALRIGIKGNLHALRKSYGYWAWKEGVSPVVIMAIFNHSSFDVTKRYIGISQDEIDQAYLAVALF